MAEIAVLAVFLLVPVVGEFDQRRAPSLGRILQQVFVLGGAQEHQRELRLVVVDAADFLQAQGVLVEFQRGIEIAHAQHGVEITHGLACSWEIIEETVVGSATMNSSKTRMRAGAVPVGSIDVPASAQDYFA